MAGGGTPITYPWKRSLGPDSFQRGISPWARCDTHHRESMGEARCTRGAYCLGVRDSVGNAGEQSLWGHTRLTRECSEEESEVVKWGAGGEGGLVSNKHGKIKGLGVKMEPLGVKSLVWLCPALITSVWLVSLNSILIIFLGEGTLHSPCMCVWCQQLE